MSLVLALNDRDLQSMITREQAEVADLVAALNVVREAIRELKTGLPQTVGVRVAADLSEAARRIDQPIRESNEKIARWTELLRQLRR